MACLLPRSLRSSPAQAADASIIPYALDSTGAKMRVCGTAGDKLVTIQLPFGSFVPDQPRATIKLPFGVSEDADLGTLLTLKARGGFRFGADALNNPTTDPSILCPNQVADAVSNSTSWTTKLDVTPTLITLKKTYSGPEDETATGPNFPRQYTIEVDVADGQTVENLDVTDFLPDNMAYLRLVSTSGGTATTITRAFAFRSGECDTEQRTHGSLRFHHRRHASQRDFLVFHPSAGRQQRRRLEPKHRRQRGARRTRPRPSAIGRPSTRGTREAPKTPSPIPWAWNTPSTIGPSRSKKAWPSSPTRVRPAPLQATSLEYTLEVQVSDFFSMDQVGDLHRHDFGRAATLKNFQPTLSAKIHDTSLGASTMTAFLAGDITPHYSAGDGSWTDRH